MVLAHAIVGITLGNYFGHPVYFLVGSIITDIDHIFILARQKIFSLEKIIDSLRFEKKYALNFKTKYLHSLFGAVIFSLPIFLLDTKGGLAFFAGYTIHLLLDWPDVDEKQYFYPLKKKFSGFLPIFSKTEMVFTIFLFLLMLASFKNISF